MLLHLAPELLQSVASELYGRNAGPVELVRCLAMPDSRADQLIRLLLAEAETPEPCSSLMIESLGRALTIHLLRFHCSFLDRARCPRLIARLRACNA